MKRFIKVLSIFLAVVMAAMMPAQALSAVRATKYISEVVTVAAGSFEEAKSLLEAAGYKIVENSNLNSSLKTGVYLGYKETTDRADAVTDIAAMNMLGKFSYSDYKQIMEEYKENIAETVSDLETSIEEFQLGCDNEDKNAVMAYTALNLFRDDDSGKTMGDYFRDYDFSDQSNKKLTDTLMQANSDIVVSMIRALTFAADPDNTTLIDRMVKTGPDGIEERYAKTYQTTAKARQAMAKEYGAVADKLYKDWDAFYAYLKNIEAEVVTKDNEDLITLRDGALTADNERINTDGMDSEEKEFCEMLDTLAVAPDIIENTTEFNLYVLLADTEFGEGTLLDYFMRPAAEVDKTELYVIVDSMSDGQRGQMDFVDIKDILLGAFSADEENDDGEYDAVAEYEKLTENIEAVSIFDGVDRSVFEDGVAFTSSAVQHEALTGKSWLDKLGGIVGGDLSYWNTTTIVCWTATAALIAIGVMANMAGKWATREFRGARDAWELAKEVFGDKIDDCRSYYAFHSEAELRDLAGKFFPDVKSDLDRCTSRFDRVCRTLKAAPIVKTVSFILLFVALVFDIYTLVDFFMQDKPAEEAVPHHLMATAMTAYGEDYVYYAAAKTLSGDAADTNNHEADTTVGWLVLYTTKDANAGEPICADDIKVVTGSTDFGEDASFAHLFNETAPINFTDPNYTGAPDKTQGTYMIFSRSRNAYTASAISGGAAAIIAAAALAVGAVGGSIITSKIRKKKEA